MRYRLEQLYELMETDMPRLEFILSLADINASRHSIFVFLRDWVQTNAGDMSSELYINAVDAMKNINSYFKRYGEEPFFRFNENDWRTVLLCASDFNSLMKDYAVKKTE